MGTDSESCNGVSHTPESRETKALDGNERRGAAGSVKREDVWIVFVILPSRGVALVRN